ncbi:HTH-type transcriptional regulator SyrM 1 [compost metagenome]
MRGTDLVLTVARRILPQGDGHGLVVFEPPFAIPLFDFEQIWHRRRDGDLGHRWLRTLIERLLGDEEPVAG